MREWDSICVSNIVLSLLMILYSFHFAMKEMAWWQCKKSTVQITLFKILYHILKTKRLICHSLQTCS